MARWLRHSGQMNHRATRVLSRVVIWPGVAVALSLASPNAGGSVPSPVKHYGDSALSFRYPADWQISHFAEVSTFTTLDVVVSNQQLHDPCTTTTTPQVVQTSCGLPITRLSNSGVFVEWSVNSFPTSTMVNLNGSSGRRGSLGGLTDSVDVARPGVCRGMVEGQETISVTAARPKSRNDFTMLACLRGPRLQSLSNDVLAMLSSTTFHTN